MATRAIELDFETRSPLDLSVCGADKYALDPRTSILCCSFISPEVERPYLWWSSFGVGALPLWVKDLLINADQVVAHNARFDKLIYECIAVNDFGFPEIPDQKWVCSAARARVNALPSSLDGVTRAIDSKHKKDHKGKALIRKLCVPDGRTGEYCNDPDALAELGDYCVKDTLAASSINGRLRKLSDADMRDWTVNEAINDYGVRIDVELAMLAEIYAETEKKEIADKLSDLTNGVIDSPTKTARALKLIMADHGNNSDIVDCVTKIVDGQKKLTFDKNAREQLLELETLPPFWRSVIGLINDGGKSSVSKFKRMRAMAIDGTDRVHGAFVFAGAGQTQRYASRGLQLHNMARKCFTPEQTEEIKGLMLKAEPINTPDRSTMDTLSMLLRPAIIPSEGNTFIVGDWSAIEARVLPWLSKSKGGDEVLDSFRELDAKNDPLDDIYIRTAASMKIDDRQIGKVANLSLGYGGGAGAFNAMAANYGLELPEHQVLKVVRLWRRANPWAVKFWDDLERAAKKAIVSPEKPFSAGRVQYVYVPKLLNGTLMCILPNGTVIQYPQARLNARTGVVSAMKASLSPRADSESEWPRMNLWGGFLAENVSQAVSGCLLRELLNALITDGFMVVAHVHDEVIVEAKKEEAVDTAAELKEYMEFTPDWCPDLPLVAEPEIMGRYGK